jgi:hypothetical protein
MPTDLGHSSPSMPNSDKPVGKTTDTLSDKYEKILLLKEIESARQTTPEAASYVNSL